MSAKRTLLMPLFSPILSGCVRGIPITNSIGLAQAGVITTRLACLNKFKASRGC